MKLQNLEQQNNIEFKLYKMGACYIVAQNNDDLVPPTISSAQIKENIRNEVSNQLEDKSKKQIITSVEGLVLSQKKGSFKSKSIIKTPSLRSVKAVQSFNRIRQKEGNESIYRFKNAKLAEPSINLRVIQKENSVRKSQKSLNSEYSYLSQQQSYYGYQQMVEDSSLEFVQTPDNRIYHEQLDMIGKGVTDTENQQIQLSLATNEPINIKGVRLMNKSFYSGYILKGKKHGMGILKWLDGSTYEGLWQNNKSQGKGILIYEDGQTYEGDWHENKAHGNGIFTYIDGSMYDGEWANNMKEGNGIFKWGNEQKYVGQWSAGRKHGYGQLFFQDGCFYKGEFYQDQLHGKGIYYWKNQKTYNGEWFHNIKRGKGTMNWQNGDCYNGQFSNDKFNGYGVFTNKDKSSSAGIWENGRKEGMFTQKDTTGKIQEVAWQMGKRAKLQQQIDKKDKQKRHKFSDDSKTTRSVGYGS